VTRREVAEMALASLSAKAKHTQLSVCELRLARQIERELSYADRWPTTSHPRSCCVVCPETAAQHGHPLDEAALDDSPAKLNDAAVAGLDDEKAMAALRARAMKEIAG
jgi:hypothetical protein